MMGIPISLCWLLALLGLAAGSAPSGPRENSLGFCYEEYDLPLDVKPRKRIHVQENGYYCCASINLKTKRALYSPAGEYLEWRMMFVNESGGFCELRPSMFLCCCEWSLCNDNNFLIYHFHSYIEYYFPPSLFNEFMTVFVMVPVVGAPVLCFYVMRAQGRRRGRCLDRTEYVNLRGLKVLPYVTKEELRRIKHQIRFCHTMEPPELNTMEERPRLAGVYTFSTTKEVTNRELGAIDIVVPKKGMKDFRAILMQVLNAGPRELNFSAKMLMAICDRAMELFATEPTLLEVYGDIHGQYSDLLRFFHINGWPPTTRCVFLGDYVDRGRHSIEVIVLLLLLKICMPHDVFLCRGNHEDPSINRAYSFFAEVESRMPRKGGLNGMVFAKFMDTFSMIPLAARMGCRVIGMHGGISPLIRSLEDIRQIRRPVALRNGSLASDLTWSDPVRNARAYKRNFKRDPRRGVGFEFGPGQVDEFCKQLDLFMVVRGHQAPQEGFEWFGARLMTLFSAPGYRADHDRPNLGASLFIHLDGRLLLTRLMVCSRVRLVREIQRMEKHEEYTDLDSLGTDSITASE